MLKICESQLKAFRAASEHAFEMNMTQHVSRYFPNHARMMGTSRTLEVVRFAMARGASYGFTTQREVCLYLTVMLMLGSHFDRDMLLPWASEILTEQEPASRLDRLVDHTLRHMDRIAGVNNQYINRALLRIRACLPAIIDQPHLEGLGFEDSMRAHFQKVFPTRYQTLGEALVRDGIVHAAQASARFGLSSSRGQAMYTSLILFFGTAFVEDPQLARLAEILRDPRLDGPDSRAFALRDACISYLELWLNQPIHLEQDDV